MMQNIISAAFKSRQNISKYSLAKKDLILSLPINKKEITLHITSALGILAMAILVTMFIKPDLTHNFKELSPFSKEISDANEDVNDTSNIIQTPANIALLMATPQLVANARLNDAMPSHANFTNEKQFVGTDAQQKLVTNWLSKRYRVANDAVNMLVSATYLTANEVKVDPLLILSVIAIESRFNPFSESPVGAQGLMQVMSKVHHDKFSKHGGVKAALNPVANIKVGALILKDYIKRSGGSVEGGLKRYVGAADMETDGGYGFLVLAEYKRLQDVAAGKQVSIYATTAKPVITAKTQTESQKVKVEALPITNPVTQVTTHNSTEI